MIDKKYPAGSIILFTSGDYSDFHHIGIYATTRKVDLVEAAALYRSEFTPDDNSIYDEPDPNGFAAWLVVKGWCFPCEVSEEHLGSYGRLEIDE